MLARHPHTNALLAPVKAVGWFKTPTRKSRHQHLQVWFNATWQSIMEDAEDKAYGCWGHGPRKII